MHLRRQRAMHMLEVDGLCAKQQWHARAVTLPACAGKPCKRKRRMPQMLEVNGLTKSATAVAEEVKAIAAHGGGGGGSGGGSGSSGGGGSKEALQAVAGRLRALQEQVGCWFTRASLEVKYTVLVRPVLARSWSCIHTEMRLAARGAGVFAMLQPSACRHGHSQTLARLPR